MKLKFGSWSLTPYLIVIAFIGLQSCGGGGSTPPAAADANPVGYYSGTLSTVSPVQNPVNANAKAIVDSDKFLMVHIDNTGSNSLLYKGTFTDITATTFTADVRIYHNGAFLRTATISNGTITEKSSMTATLSGTGDYTSTSFSLTYDTTINARTPIISVSADQWFVPTNTPTGFIFSNTAATEITNTYENIAIVHDALKGCGVANIALIDVASEQVGRIRTYTANYTTSDLCENFVSDFSMTAYMTTFDSVVGGTNDDRYLWITYNDNNFFADALVKQ
ncbi:MAG: hypothetical protein KAT06_07585 [Gammaproteobacteria bacterium]|nr:hypothetical protein [Gammaproteobacteria bacterium]